MRGLSGTGLGRGGLFTFGVITLLAIGTFALAGREMLKRVDAQPAKRAIQATGAQEATPEAVAQTAAKTADKTEPKSKADQVERAVKEPDPVPDKASDSASASGSAPASASPPADTLMYLSVPAMGISDIPVVEGTSEASLSQGAGHVPGTGYPWVPGSNTYIAGHRIGYPGTPSDHVFWNLPNLGQGDQILLTDSNGTTYTYAVSEIFEVSPTDLSVTAPTGGDVVSLQTCIEDYGDYWTPGPNWFVRYVVRAERV
ncbi:MAG TPA: class E sortase [Rubrobacter sp.]|nr:class E sortase [Rubrobacter sp.]